MIRLWRLATWAMLRLFFWFHFETIKDSKQYSQVQGKSLVCFFCCCSYPGEALFTSLQMGIISTVCVTSYWALLLLSRSGIGVPLKDGYGIWKTEEWLYNRCFPFFYRHLVLHTYSLCSVHVNSRTWNVTMNQKVPSYTV